MALIEFDDVNHAKILVIGVGGGGGNAVNHMYKEGIHDVVLHYAIRTSKYWTTRRFPHAYRWDRDSEPEEGPRRPANTLRLHWEPFTTC